MLAKTVGLSVSQSFNELINQSINQSISLGVNKKIVTFTRVRESNIKCVSATNTKVFKRSSNTDSDGAEASDTQSAFRYIMLRPKTVLRFADSGALDLLQLNSNNCIYRGLCCK